MVPYCSCCLCLYFGSSIMLVTYFVNFRKLNDHLFGKELFILFAASAFRKLSSIYVFSYFPFGFEGRIWDLIVSVPDHCLSFYFFKLQDILCAEVELRDLKVKALVWKRNCETSSHTKFIVWKRKCVTSKSQYFPCAEAELRHFRAPKSHTFLYAEPELRNFKSQYFLFAEAELQAKEYSMCGSGNAELQVK